MSGTVTSLRRKLDGVAEIQSVVRTMKALAASNIGQYERAVRALADYCRAVELGLSARFRTMRHALHAVSPRPKNAAPAPVGAIVFGSDLGLVGQFNEVIANHAVRTLSALPGQPRAWAVGERIQVRLADAGFDLAAMFAVPDSVQTITRLAGQIQLAIEAYLSGDNAQFYLFYNRHQPGAAYLPTALRLLPLDESWRQAMANTAWPTRNLPEIPGNSDATLRLLIREYLFISLFRACAESLASENASRLAAMQRADKNIEELLETLTREFHSARQNGIDEEMFDVISGVEALRASGPPGRQSL